MEQCPLGCTKSSLDLALANTVLANTAGGSEVTSVTNHDGEHVTAVLTQRRRLSSCKQEGFSTPDPGDLPQWFLSMPTRPFLIRTLPAVGLTALLFACGGDEGGFGKPGVTVDHVTPLSLVFPNSLTEDIFVPWPDNQPLFTLNKGEVELTTRRGCVPLCGDGCSCSPCTTPASRVRRVPAGESLTVTWDPVHYVANTCSGSTDCHCVELWPITAGRYRLSLDGFTQAEGGQEVTGLPNVFLGAYPGEEAKTCSAVAEFDLADRSATMDAEFTCSD